MTDATDALARAAQAFLDHLTPGDTHTGCPERLTLDRAIEQAAEGQPVERGAAHTKRLSSTPSAAVDLDVEALADWLVSLARHGYQPMYNGRPSCPFCDNFVDEEETHTSECGLAAYAAAKEADR